MKCSASLILSLVVLGRALADDPDPRTAPSHFVTGAFGRSLIVLGSEDGRLGGGLGYAYGRPEKRFQFGTIPAQLIYEGYLDATRSNGSSGYGPNSTIALGGLAYARWRWQVDSRGNGVFVDLGWGLQLADHTTLDLNSQLNSTPFLRIGGAHRVGREEYFVGLGYLHISNAGLARPNFGQNELFLTVAIRY